MADNTIKLRLEIEGKGAKDVEAQLKNVVTQVKLLDIEMRQGGKSAKDVELATKSLELQLQRAFAKGQISAKQYQSTLATVFHVSERANSGFVSMSQSITGIQRNTANALPALMSFSRIVQDMPFGIMGISNNITMLAEQFVFLRKETGSVGSAVKSMMGLLKGPGGILMGVSIVTTLAMVFKDKLFPAVEDTRKSMEDLHKAMLDLGEMSKIEFTGELVKKMNQLNQEAAKLNQSAAFWAALGGVIPGASLFAPSTGQLTGAQTAAKRAQSQVRGQFKTGPIELEDQFTFGTRPRSKSDQLMPLMDKAAFKAQMDREFMMAGMGRIDEDIDRQMQRGFEKAFDAGEQELNRFSSVMDAGFKGMGMAIQQHLIGALRNVFGEGKSLLGDLVAGFVGSFIGQGIGIVTGGLWDKILPGSVGDVVKEASGNRSIGFNSSNKTAQINITGITRGEDIRYVVDRNDRNRANSVTF